MHTARADSALANPSGVQGSFSGLTGGRATPGYSWRTPPGFSSPTRRTGILERALAEIIAVLERDDEEGCRLRQSSPFAGILSPQEVWKLNREFKETHETR